MNSNAISDTGIRTKPRWWRWVLLDLMLTAAVCVAAAKAQRPHSFNLNDPLCSLFLPLSLLPQALLLLIVGPSVYVRSMSPGRLLLAICVVGLLLAALLETSWPSIEQLLRTEYDLSATIMLLAVLLAGLAGICIWSWRRERLVVLQRLALCILAASVCQLCIAVPANALVTWPGTADTDFDLEVVITGIGVTTGALVLSVSVGPVLAVLYLRRVRAAMRGCCPACGYELTGLSEMRCPECGRTFTFEEVHATAEELRFEGAGVMS